MLIELFLSESKEDQAKFQEQFEQIMSEVPNKIANKESFWIYFFLGSVLALPGELKINKIAIKLGDDQKSVDLCITIENKIVYRSIRIGARHVPVIEYEDVNSSNDSEFIKIDRISESFDLSYINKESLKEPFKNLTKVYNHYQLKQKPEALHQAFIYGFFKMNTDIKCLYQFQ